MSRDAGGDGHALRLRNRRRGGGMAVEARSTPFDAASFPVLEFDYRLDATVRVGFFLEVDGRWYHLGFADDTNPGAFQRVNVGQLGELAGIVRDGAWHHARVDLLPLLERHTRHTVVDRILVADWVVDGYMKLRPGNSPRGATLDVDDFAIRRSPTPVEHVERPAILVLDLDGALPALDGSFAFQSPTGAVLRPQIVAGPGGAHALALQFDLAGEGTWAGYALALGERDLRGYGGLRLSVQADGGVSEIVLGLVDAGGPEAKVRVPLHAGAPGAWQTVDVPLSAFWDITRWDAVRTLTMAFVGGRATAGTVRVGDVEFRPGVSAVEIEDFELADERNLIGGRHGPFAFGAAAINAAVVGAPGAGVLRLSFGGTIGAVPDEPMAWAVWSTELRGLDCTACGDLVFRIRGAHGGERPTVYLDDGIARWGVPLARDAAPTREWRSVAVPLAEFAAHGVDLSHLERVQIVFEWEAMSGTVYVDDLALRTAASGDGGSAEALGRNVAGR